MVDYWAKYHSHLRVWRLGDCNLGAGVISLMQRYRIFFSLEKFNATHSLVLVKLCTFFPGFLE